MCFSLIFRVKLWSVCFFRDGLFSSSQNDKLIWPKKIPVTFFTGVQDNVVANSIRFQLHMLKFFKNFERDLPCHSLLTNRHDCIVVIPESQGTQWGDPEDSNQGSLLVSPRPPQTKCKQIWRCCSFMHIINGGYPQNENYHKNPYFIILWVYPLVSFGGVHLVWKPLINVYSAGKTPLILFQKSWTSWPLGNH